VERANKGTGSTIGTTGGHVWDAARRLADFLETEEDELKLRRPGTGCSAVNLCLPATTHLLLPSNSSPAQRPIISRPHPLCASGLKVIELGAGCGWLGLTVAKNIPSATVLLTEMEGAWCARALARLASRTALTIVL
jgi:hypothetical protein